MTVTINGTTGIAGVDGSAATPAVQGVDTNTGVFYGTDIVAISTGGTERVRVNASGQAEFTAGTAALPAIATTGDTNTGMFFPAADTIAFAEGGAEAMRINSSGNVGIGTASPGARVDVRTAALGTALQLSDDTNYGANFIGISGGLKLAMNGAQTFSVFQATDERLTIDGSGNLKFNSGYGSAAVAYGCRAWVNFNGTGTVAIRASGNVSSITDNGTGSYTINFTTAMPDANYSVDASSSPTGSNPSQVLMFASITPWATSSPAASNFTIATVINSLAYTDIPFICLSVSR